MQESYTRFDYQKYCPNLTNWSEWDVVDARVSRDPDKTEGATSPI